MPKNARKPQSKPKPDSKSKSRNKPNKTGNNYASMGSLMAADFARTLKDPFHPDSFGARVPDPFSFPTAVYHLHGTTIIGNSAGVGEVCFLPNPVLSMIDLSRSSGNTAAVSLTSMQAYTNTASCFGATTPPAIGPLLSTYRVVSWGLKISNTQPELVAQGRLIMAPFTIGDAVPTYSLLSNTLCSPTFISNNILGTNLSMISNNAGVLNYPGAIELSVQDLLHGDLEIGCSVTSPTFYDFKNTVSSNVPNSTSFSGDEMAGVTATGVIMPNASSYKDTTRMHGGVGWIMYFEGVPPESLRAFQVEYVYHLEGTPELGNPGTINAGLVPVPSVPPIHHTGSTAIVEQAISTVSTKNAMSWITTGAGFLNKASQNATGQGILQHAERIAGLNPYTKGAFKIGKMIFGR